MKPSLLILFLSAVIHILSGQKPAEEVFTLLVGTYPTSGTTEDLYVCEFNSISGEIRLITHKTGIENPSYLAISPDNQYVYAVNEVSEGGLSAFRFNPATRDLEFINIHGSHEGTAY